MEEEYWEQFMASGLVTDYLHYRNAADCENEWAKVGSMEQMDAGNRGKCSESDNSYRNDHI